ncbi:cyclase [Halobacteriales archaeon QS_8_69_26]|nr:MAG: cyclase [Halobacteriales archaeon QS_8_69_26]
MATSTFRRATRVKAPFPEVWEFYSGIEGLELLTPLWVNLRVASARGPDGEPDPEVLEPGSRVRISASPFGVVPRVRWTSRITERVEEEQRAYFRDVMEDGPFDYWEHTHSFFVDDEGDDPATVVLDRIEYRLPGGWLGESVSPMAVVGMEPMFRYRHHMTRTLLE